MIKQIRSDQLPPGMDVHDLNCGWLDPFVSNACHGRDQAAVDKIVNPGIRELSSDTVNGANVREARSEREVNAQLDRRLQEIAEKQAARPVVIRAIGIYPTGPLVRLESRRLGVVVEPNDGNLRAPVVRVFYHAGQPHYIPPEMVDLCKVQDGIASFENYEKWKIDPYQWLPA